MLAALEEHLQPTRSIVLRGPAAGVTDWQRELARRYLPATLVLPVPNDAREVPGNLAKPPTDAVNAWVCEGVTCLPPVGDPAALATLVFKERQSD